MAKASRSKSRAAASIADPNQHAATPLPQITHEEIALRAYQIYIERGGAAGNELSDWLRAERELTEQTAPRSEDERGL